MAVHVPPRIFRRVPFETAVRLQFDRFKGFVDEYSSNLSLGGMFIRTDEPRPVGEEMPIEFRLGEDYELIRGRGRVVWVREEELDDEHPVGMGIRFLELTPGSRELIFKLVERRVRDGGDPFDLEAEAEGLEDVLEDLPRRPPEPGPAPEGPVPAAALAMAEEASVEDDGPDEGALEAEISDPDSDLDFEPEPDAEPELDPAPEPDADEPEEVEEFDPWSGSFEDLADEDADDGADDGVPAVAASGAAVPTAAAMSATTAGAAGASADEVSAYDDADDQPPGDQAESLGLDEPLAPEHMEPQPFRLGDDLGDDSFAGDSFPGDSFERANRAPEPAAPKGEGWRADDEESFARPSWGSGAVGGTSAAGATSAAASNAAGTAVGARAASSADPAEPTVRRVSPFGGETATTAPAGRGTGDTPPAAPAYRGAPRGASYEGSDEESGSRLKVAVAILVLVGLGTLAGAWWLLGEGGLPESTMPERSTPTVAEQEGDEAAPGSMVDPIDASDVEGGFVGVRATPPDLERDGRLDGEEGSVDDLEGLSGDELAAAAAAADDAGTAGDAVPGDLPAGASRPDPSAAGAAASQPGQGSLSAGAADTDTAAAGAPLAVQSVTHSASAGRTVVTIQTSRPLGSGDFAHFPMPGLSPRHVIRFLGVDSPLPAGQVVVGTPQVSLVRSGLHRDRDPSELHLVLDFNTDAARVTQITPQGSSLQVVVEGGGG